MALLITIELFSMLFTMDILSAVRSFVGGEGLWSKSQKDAMQSLHKYAASYDRKYYLEFREHLKVNLGDRQARLEMLKPEPDLEKVRDGFLQGKIHPNDIEGLIYLFRNFYYISYIDRAIRIWTEADEQLDQVIGAATDLDAAVSSRDQSRIATALREIDALNSRLTTLENDFSYVLGEGSRWLEKTLRWLLIFAVLAVEGTGLYLTFSFSRNLSRSLTEMDNVADMVGKGDFTQVVPVRSKDEIGRLAETINRMSRALQRSIGRREDAESASQVKTLFLANMSHEIRSPLGVILGLTEALKQSELSQEQKKFVETIQRTGNDLKRIVNDILDISKVEAGHLDVDKTRFRLRDFVRELESTLRPSAAKNKNKLDFVPIGTIRDETYTDAVRLRQILVNLIGNSLKFTQQGSVTARYWTAPGELHFQVLDDGIGMGQEQISQLFTPFSQGDSSTTRKFGGTGLGLFLSKRLANALGGDLTLEESKKGKGSRFHVMVKSDLEDMPTGEILVTPKPPNAEGAGPNLKGRKVLVVDDSADNHFFLGHFLEKWGMEVDNAYNGQEAIDKALAQEYDLVLMDMQMPILDGYEATRELREKGYGKPIIALTAHAMKEDQRRCLGVGCNDYLSKPVEFETLYSAFRRLFS